MVVLALVLTGVIGPDKSGEIADYSGESDHPGFHGTYEISHYEDRMLDIRLFDENGEVWNEATMMEMDHSYGMLFSDTEAVYHWF